MITRTVNITLAPWNADEIALIEGLNYIRKSANAIETGNHAYQSGTYGAVSDALIKSISVAVFDHSAPEDDISWDEAEAIARCLYGSALENNENITYQQGLWNQNVISA